MASYSDMIAQIEDLKRQAEKQRKEEYSSVLKTIKKQIADYGITAEELGLGAAAPAKRGRKAGRPAGAAKTPKTPRTPRAKRSASGSKVAPKYSDNAGNTWTGRGKMPTWLTQAIASGRTQESFLIQAPAAA